jgi:hypothetical protein
VAGGGRTETNDYSLNFSCPLLWYEMNGRAYVISGFHREADDNRTVPGYCAASSGDYLRTFRDNLSVPSSRDKMRPINNKGPIGSPETSVMNGHYSLRNDPEERRSP